MSILIPAQTAAASSKVGEIKHYQFPATFVADGLAGAETVAVHISANGTTFFPMLDYSTGLPVQLDATHNSLTIVSPANLQLVKSVSAAAVEVGISTAAKA